MPRKFRAAKETRELNVTQRFALLTGTVWFYQEDFKTEEEREAAWYDYREELMTYWAQDPDGGKWDEFANPQPGGPFTRCWAWWKFESKEPRRRIGGNGIDYPEQGLSFGVPHTFADDYGDDGPQYESERDYLIRLNLLTAEEKRVLKAERSAPESTGTVQ